MSLSLCRELQKSHHSQSQSFKWVGALPCMPIRTVAITWSVIMLTFICEMQWHIPTLCTFLKSDDLGMDSTCGTFKHCEYVSKTVCLNFICKNDSTVFTELIGWCKDSAC